MSTSDLIALEALGVAFLTLILAIITQVWNVWAWSKDRWDIKITAKLGPRLKGAHMNHYLWVNIFNNGGKTTTITDVGFNFYSTRLSYFLRRPSKKLIFTKWDDGKALPHTLDPGNVWSAKTSESIEDFELFTSCLNPTLIRIAVYMPHNEGSQTATIAGDYLILS